MSFSGIQAPYSFASLPVPLDNHYGKTLVSPVYGYRAGSKRKRYEVAAGIDGESVNIYNIQTHNLVTSYALPPSTELCCPPASVHVHVEGTGKSQRQTYLLVRNGRENSKRRLISIKEDILGRHDQPAGEGLGLASPTITEAELPDASEAVSVEAIVQTTTGPRDERTNDTQPRAVVLVTFKRGDVWCYDSQSRKGWQELVAETKDIDGFEVRHSSLTTVDAVRSGILKSSHDVLAVLESSNASTLPKVSTVLCQVTHTSSSAHIRLYSIRNTPHSIDQSWRLTLHLITSCSIPCPRQSKMGTATYDVHAASGMLYRLVRGKLTIIDLSTTVPSTVIELGGKKGKINNYARVSSSTILCVSDATVTLYETSYGSPLAVIPLELRESSTHDTRKRKRDDDQVSRSVFTPVSAFPDLQLVVGLSGHELMAMHLTHSARPSSHKVGRNTLLAEVINKGIFDTNTRRQHRDQRNDSQWQDWKAQIDQLVLEDDTIALEHFIRQDEDLGNGEGLNDFDEDSASEPQKAFNTNGQVNIDRQKVLYILTKIFGLSQGPEEKLEIRLNSAKLLVWLACLGYLSIANLQAAFPRFPIRAGDVFAAISRWDSNFQAMWDLLRLPLQWELEEMVFALKVLLQSFRTSTQHELSHTAPEQAGMVDDTEMMPNEPTEAQIERETEAAQKELDRTSAIFTNGLEVRGDILRVILLRLHAHPRKRIVSAMRSILTHEDLIFFIELMRLELAYGGWTSQYVDGGDDDALTEGMVNAVSGVSDRGPSDQAVKAIGEFLICAVDAIGTNGWLVGLSGHEQHATSLIESLRAEVSAGLEGCYEAAMIGEFLCTLESSRLSSHRVPGSFDEGMEPEKTPLPLGGRFESVSNPTRDGEVKKSKTALAQEKSREVNKYSLDHIRF